MFNFPNCRDCNATLPIATGICPHCTQLSPAPAQQSQSDSVAAPAEVGQGLGTTLPVDVPESDTLWQFLTKGYSLNGIRRALVCGDPHAEAEARMLIERARKNWAQIRSEVGE